MTATILLIVSFVYTAIVSHRCYFYYIFKSYLANIFVQALYLLIFIYITIITAVMYNWYIAVLPGFWVFLSVIRLFSDYSEEESEDDNTENDNNSEENEQVDDDNDGNKKER